MAVAIFVVLFFAVTGAAMGLLWWIGVTNRWARLVGAGFSGGLLGAFLASTVAAMATGVNPDAALLRGLALGFVFGVAAGGVWLAVARAVRNLRAG